MNHIEVLAKAFAAVCSREECQAIIDEPKIACGENAGMFETPGSPKSPETIISECRGCNVEWQVFDALCDAVDELRPEESRRGLDRCIPYLDALEQATESDVREAARMAKEGKE